MEQGPSEVSKFRCVSGWVVEHDQNHFWVTVGPEYLGEDIPQNLKTSFNIVQCPLFCCFVCLFLKLTVFLVQCPSHPNVLPSFWFPILLTYFWTGSGEVYININLTYKHYDVFLLYGEQGNVPNCRYLYSKEMYFLPHTCDRHSIIF